MSGHTFNPSCLCNRCRRKSKRREEAKGTGHTIWFDECSDFRQLRSDPSAADYQRVEQRILAQMLSQAATGNSYPYLNTGRLKWK